MLNVSKNVYSWQEWRDDYQEDLWQLYYALTKAGEAIDTLDCLEFHDFISFCQRHTSRPTPPELEINSVDLESQVQEEPVSETANAYDGDDEEY